MNKKREYSIFKILLYLHIENIHRYVYDNYYFQNFHIKFNHRLLIIYYNNLTKYNTHFRYYLKLVRISLQDGHRKCKLSYVDEFVYLTLIKRGIIRYGQK